MFDIQSTLHSDISILTYPVMINQLINKYCSLSPEELNQREVFAVEVGAPVTYSSFYDATHIHPQLDFKGVPPQCWAPKKLEVGQWIQVSQEQPKVWRGLIIQGRGDMEQWVTSLKVAYTINGKSWDTVDNGKVFKCETVNCTKKEYITFQQPVIARALRIYPQTYHGYMSLRLEAVYVDLS